MPLDFTAIDFETANSSNASACAVGFARVRGGRIVETAGWLIRPPAGHDRFFELNVRIHGIEAHDVDRREGLERAARPISPAFAGGDVLVAHNAGFDMAVLKRACEATGDECPPYRYACSLQVARKVYQLESYRLPFVAAEAGFADFPHHNATADAACLRAHHDRRRTPRRRRRHRVAGGSGIRPRLADLHRRGSGRLVRRRLRPAAIEHSERMPRRGARRMSEVVGILTTWTHSSSPPW